MRQPTHAPTFAAMLLRTRIGTGQSQEELAARSGLSVRAISDLERGRVTRPRRSSAEMLATALGLADEQRRDFLRSAGLIAEESPRHAVAGSLCTLPPRVRAARGQGWRPLGDPAAHGAY